MSLDVDYPPSCRLKRSKRSPNRSVPCSLTLPVRPNCRSLFRLRSSSRSSRFLPKRARGKRKPWGAYIGFGHESEEIFLPFHATCPATLLFLCHFRSLSLCVPRKLFVLGRNRYDRLLGGQISLKASRMTVKYSRKMHHTEAEKHKENIRKT